MSECFIIGISGGSASGKSTLANRLVNKLSKYNTKLIAMDSYYKPECELPMVTLDNGKQYKDYNCPDSFYLEQLKNDLNEATKNFNIVIIEGLLTLWDSELCQICNLRVFVDCPSDIRIIRRIKRNLTWGLSFEEITDVYIDLVRNRHNEFVEPSKENADIIIDSSFGIEHGLNTLLENIDLYNSNEV